MDNKTKLNLEQELHHELADTIKQILDTEDAFATGNDGKRFIVDTSGALLIDRTSGKRYPCKSIDQALDEIDDNDICGPFFIIAGNFTKNAVQNYLRTHASEENKGWVSYEDLVYYLKDHSYSVRKIDQAIGKLINSKRVAIYRNSEKEINYLKLIPEIDKAAVEDIVKAGHMDMHKQVAQYLDSQTLMRIKMGLAKEERRQERRNQG